MKLLGRKLFSDAALPGGDVLTPVLRKEVRSRCELRRADRFTLLAAAAAVKLGDEIGLTVPWDDATALLTVTAFGPHSTVFAALDDILDFPEDEFLPSKFSHSVHNAAAGYLCAALELHGPVFALNGMENSFYEALRFAGTILQLAMARQVLLIGVEEHGLLPSRAPDFAPERFRPGQCEGALALLLEGGAGAGRFGRVTAAPEPDREYREQVFAFGVTRGTLAELAAAGPESRIVWR